MEVLSGLTEGALVLHFLTVAAPLAALIVASGAIRWRATFVLLMLGVAATGATVLVTAVVPTTHHARIEYGAPMPLARGAWDMGSAEASDIAILQVNLAGDLAFWCCGAIVVGSLVAWLFRSATRRGRSSVQRTAWRRSKDAGGSPNDTYRVEAPAALGPT